MDDVEVLLNKKFMRFIMQRAESFLVIRRKPVKEYDISFLITNVHTESMYKDKLVNFILDFMSDIDKDIKDMKIQQTSRFRLAAKTYLQAFK
jgi:actin related protein 2/3 complex subunit 4